jgi:hypothetical protein
VDEIKLLQRFEGPPTDPAPEVVASAWVGLVREVDRSADAPPGRGLVSGRRWVVAVAVAAVAAGAVVAVPAILPEGHPGSAGPVAASALFRAAHIARDLPAEAPPGPGQYVYTKTVSTQTLLYIPGHGLANFSFTEPLVREAWIGSDGSGRTIETSGDVTFPTPADRVAWEEAGMPDLKAGEASGDETYPPGKLYFVDASTLPTGHEELKAVLEKREVEGGPKGDWETFTIVGDLLRETWAPPRVRAALYEVAANLPGVEWVGHVSDDMGRPGLAVAYTHGGVRDELFFDADTAQLLGSSSILIDPDAVGIDVDSEAPGTIVAYVGPPGEVVYSAVYLASGVVDSTKQRP